MRSGQRQGRDPPAWVEARQGIAAERGEYVGKEFAGFCKATCAHSSVYTSVCRDRRNTIQYHAAMHTCAIGLVST